MDFSDPRYVMIEDKYISSLAFYNYPHEIDSLILEDIIESNQNVSVSMFYEKQDTVKAIKDLTFHIGNIGANIDDNILQRDIAAFTKDDVTYIRKQLQLNNEELYYLYIYITLIEDDLQTLLFNINKLEGLLLSKGFQTRKLYFRLKEAYLTQLPIYYNSPMLKSIARRNVLTSGMLGTYPFISSSIFDQNGILIGQNMHNKSLILVDRFNEKYKNSNMIIFGTSGAGKSFFNKIMILRYFLNNYTQFIIDIENEYTFLSTCLDASIIRLGNKSNNYVNIMDIRSNSLEDGEVGYLASKITKLIGFFTLIFGELSTDDKSRLEEKLIQTYKKFNITFDDRSLFENGKFKTNFPILEDFYNELATNKDTKKFLIKLKPFINGSLSFFNKRTNVKFDNNLMIANIYDLPEEHLRYGMYVIIDIFWDMIKASRKAKKIIYFDEVWKLIGITSNKEIASFIFKIYKTIRKYGGSAVAITQDVYDLFALDNGAYGRSILNNSEFKVFFSLEEENIKVLQKNIELSEKEILEIKASNRSEALIFIGNNHIQAKIICSDYEKEQIEKIR